MMNLPPLPAAHRSSEPTPSQGTNYPPSSSRHFGPIFVVPLLGDSSDVNNQLHRNSSSSSSPPPPAVNACIFPTETVPIRTTDPGWLEYVRFFLESSSRNEEKSQEKNYPPPSKGIAGIGGDHIYFGVLCAGRERQTRTGAGRRSDRPRHDDGLGTLCIVTSIDVVARRNPDSDQTLDIGPQGNSDEDDDMEENRDLMPSVAQRRPRDGAMSNARWEEQNEEEAFRQRDEQGASQVEEELSASAVGVCRFRLLGKFDYYDFHDTSAHDSSDPTTTTGNESKIDTTPRNIEIIRHYLSGSDSSFDEPKPGFHFSFPVAHPLDLYRVQLLPERTNHPIAPPARSLTLRHSPIISSPLLHLSHLSGIPYPALSFTNPVRVVEAILSCISSSRRKSGLDAALLLTLPPKDVTMDPIQFSYWSASNVFLAEDRRREVFAMDCVWDRLRAIHEKILEEDDGNRDDFGEVFPVHDTRPRQTFSVPIACAGCDVDLATVADVFTVEGAPGTVGAYINPHGVIHQTLTVSRVREDYVIAIGGQHVENSYFPGYSWQIICCRFCTSHLGWKFVVVEEGKGNNENRREKNIFWGLCTSSVVEVRNRQIRN